MQSEFHFEASGDDSGLREREGRERQRRALLLEEISREWGLPLGEVVVVWLRNPEIRLTGRLEIARPPTEIRRDLPLALRLRGQSFLSSEIASCVLAE